MLTGVFRDRTRLQRQTAQTAHRALAELIQSKALQPYRAAHHCAVGPFVVDYVFQPQSLIVELEPLDQAGTARSQGRTAFLNQMGYSVLCISRRELRAQPQRVMEQIRAALR